MSEPKKTESDSKSAVVIPIKGRDYTVSASYLRHQDLRFYPENPRIYSVLHDSSGESPTQEDIQSCLQNMDHVRELKEDIKENGGLIEPLYVKEATLEVVEGNSRLAAYRMLADENAVLWEKVKCAMLPKEVDDSAIASLLGQLHLKGKKDWRPYEQASFLHRRHYKDGISVPELAKEIPLKARGIKHRIAVIDYMIKQGDNKIERWSHYDELLKNRKIQEAFKDHAGFEEAVVKKIKSGNIKAVEVRDKLKVVVRTKSEKPIKQFINGSSIDDAVKTAKSLGGDYTALHKIKRFRLWVVEGSTKRDIQDAPEKVKEEIRWELKKIKAQVTTLIKVAK
jgi:predicted DNA-binding protein YlxM (UPF0122 family)